jgi:hypothetical protein
VNAWTYTVNILGLSFTLKTQYNLVQYPLFTNELKATQIIQRCSENMQSGNVLPRVLVTNDGGSGLDERVYLLFILTNSNYT